MEGRLAEIFLCVCFCFSVCLFFDKPKVSDYGKRDGLSTIKLVQLS